MIKNGPASPNAVHVTAERAEVSEQGKSTLVNNVQILRGDEQGQAERVVYDRATQVLDASGGVQLWKKDIYATGSTGRMDVRADTSTLSNASYIIGDAHAHGTARHVELTGKNLLRVKDGSYTTCNPDDAAWMLKAGYLRLDKSTNVGIARNVTLRFYNVPVFYSPFLTFPLSHRRKSGFLIPSVGMSTNTGVEATIPYYWNIAPQQDATFTARTMSNRGVILGGQYRYLTHRGKGEISGQILPDDSKLGTTRGLLHFNNSGYFYPRLYTDINASWVSDRQYLQDFSNGLSVSSTSFLEQRADVTYYGDGWYTSGRLLNYQTLLSGLPPTSKPYSVLPQITFATDEPQRNRSLNVAMTGEVSYFDRRASVTGTRMHLRPSLSYPLRSAYAFFIPKLSLDYTQYALSNVTAGSSSTPSRTLPVFSADSGLYLERDLKLGGGSYVQTLEPRAFYLLVPYTNQDTLPVFDTGAYTFSFAQLFREQRFSSSDRLGDANQLTLAVTSRLLSAASGAELVSASIGQIHYFRNPRVTLPGTTPPTGDSSDLVAEVDTNIRGTWRTAAGLQWNLNHGQVDKTALSVRYQPDGRHVVNASYRFVRGGGLSSILLNSTDQTDLSFRWPLAVNWSAVGRWNYALSNKSTLDVFGGLEYDSCCWSLRAVVRRYLSDANGTYNSGVFLQLDLKGLAGIGNATQFLHRSIPGYRSGF